MSDRFDRWISSDEWATIVRNVPIVSVDLVIEHSGGVILGRRENEPAKGEWFVPGGRVQKFESLTDAVHRIAREELGIDVTIRRQLGVYEHMYDESDVSEGNGKHYVANAYVVQVTGESSLSADEQHDSLRVFDDPPEDLHPYVEAYLRDAGIR